MTDINTNELLVAGASSYPQALAAINEFRRTVQQIVREVVERNLKNIAKSMDITLSTGQLMDYTRPFELGPSIDGENAAMGVCARRDGEGWRLYFVLGWDRLKLYCSASIWFRNPELAQKVYDSMLKIDCKYLGANKGEVWMCRYMKTDEVNRLSDVLGDVIQEWSGAWKQTGGLKRFQSKDPSSTQ